MRRKDKIVNIIIKVTMFISSYFPLYIMLIILYSKKIKKGIYEKNILWIIFTVTLGLLILISIGTLFLLKSGSGKKKKDIADLERPDDTVLSYLMTYVIPLIANEGSSTEVYIVNILLFILIGYIYLRLNLIYLNPLWAMFGHIVYRDVNKDIIITNLSREALKNKESLYGYYLSNDIFVAHKKDNIDY
ncbi:hypothetical protein [Clostridium cochlearium]|uniref:hypothetical protein n=1 Tax=Clostridium cochlearium TaxID=1494 RepID=UPI000DF0FB54|nr:hypothetical protein [Clostridium cochlearium]STA93577.1 Uncharacterised protein [Clostridium cochlearium]